MYGNTSYWPLSQAHHRERVFWAFTRQEGEGKAVAGVGASSILPGASPSQDSAAYGQTSAHTLF